MKIISDSEKIYLLNWIYENKKYFSKNTNGNHRYYLMIQDYHRLIPDLFFSIKNKILMYENIKEYRLEPIFKDMVTFIEKNGFIHDHIDPTQNGYKHVRFNLFLSKPDFGGEPIYGGNILNIEEGEYIKYEVDSIHHSSKPVLGNKPRITISYGILIKNEK